MYLFDTKCSINSREGIEEEKMHTDNYYQFVCYKEKHHMIVFISQLG